MVRILAVPQTLLIQPSAGTDFVSTNTITCVLTSNAICANPITATSAAITMTVTPNVVPTVAIAITAGANPACTGSSLTFAATPTNGGATPTYQWYNNGAAISGATNATYTGVAGTDFVSTDDITCVLISNAICANPITATSAGITMTVLAHKTLAYVDAAATGANNGTSWADAYTDLTTALNEDCYADEIWVAKGVYKPSAYPRGCTNCVSSRNYTFHLRDKVKIYGGFVGNESNIAQRPTFNTTAKTILSGDIDNNDTNTDGNNIAEIYTDIQGINVFHVVMGLSTTANTLIDGLLMTAAKSSSGK